MTNRSKFLVSQALLACAVSAPVTCQIQGGRSLPPLAVPIHTAPDDMGQAYGTWAARDSYKVSFHDGMTFVPYLGSDYPHNQPLSWRTRSVRLGRTELLESGAVPAHFHTDYRYEYRFTAMTEAYDVRSDGLEQTFVVHQRVGAGDLVVTGEVTSGMHSPNVAAAHQALTFSDAEGEALVGYGEAFAFDAVGDRIPVATAFADGEISLTVPAAWIARATFPVTVDPLLTRRRISAVNNGSLRVVDIGRDDEAVTANVMFVYVFSTSRYDDDVSMMLCDDDYTPRVVPFYDITASWDSDGARCAYVGGADRWAMVFRRYFGSAGIRRSLLRCHLHQSGDLTTSTSVGYMSVPSGYNDWRPDVGGVESFASGTDALVVFQREDNTNTAGHWANRPDSRIHGVLLDATTTNGTFGSSFAIRSASTHDTERPSVNQVAEGGASFSWVCAFQTYSNRTVSSWKMFAKRIDNLGAVSSHGWLPASYTNTHHMLGPVVEGQNGRYAVAFAMNDVLATPGKTGRVNGHELWVERLDWPHGSISPTGQHTPQVLATNATTVYEASGIGYDTRDDSHWAVGFRTVSPAVSSAQVARIGYTGAVTEGPLTMYVNGGHTTTGVACVFDNDHDDFLCAYGVNRPNQTLPIYGHTLEYPAAPPSSRHGTGCSPTSIQWVGNQQIGAEFNYVSAHNAQPTAGHFLLVSLGTANLPVNNPAVSPGCYLLVDGGAGYVTTMGFRTGAHVTWDFPLPESLSPFTLHFQDWVLDAGLLTSTRRLTVPFVR